VARWDCGAKWGEALAPQAQCATPLGLSLSEGLGLTRLLAGSEGLRLSLGQRALLNALFSNGLTHKLQFGAAAKTTHLYFLPDEIQLPGFGD
jgi:hypothetical protein